MNFKCYSLKEYNFNNSIFNYIEATYIIHLEGNNRLNNIKNQLKIYHPTKKVYILFNIGYKKCNKDKYINSPPLDLIDAFYTIFKDAYTKNYQNIIILEDDFIFDSKILDCKNSKNIEDFIRYKNKINETYVYHLGVIPYIQTYFGEYHNRLLLSAGCHSCIYPKTFIDYIINKENKIKINDWDYYLNKNYNRYKYYIPLCYQTFPETENSKHWGGNNVFYTILCKIIINTYKNIKLNTNVQPGYNIMEKTSKFIFWFIIMTFILIIYFIYFLYNKKNIYKNKFILLKIFIIFLLYPIFLFVVALFTVYINYYLESSSAFSY
jgi:hypothetical protein